MVKVVCATLACALTVVCARAQMAMTPPMGWNSWNHFAERVTDADVRTAADQMVSTGMRDAGYVYVNVDDTWQGERDAAGVLHTNSRFPDMKALGDYIHSKGLKFGIYSSPGAKTCGGYAGSLGHEAQDAQMYAGWGVDFLKYDLCSFADQMSPLTKRDGGNPTAAYALMRAAYKKMGDALRATGRPIVYSLCQYGVDEVWTWGPSVGAQMWRTTDDINDSYGRMISIGIEQEPLAKFAGPGRWNDPDMLEVGQRQDEVRGVPHAHEPVGSSGRSTAGGQRPERDDRRDQGAADEQGRHCHRSGPARQAGSAAVPAWRPVCMDEAAGEWHGGSRPVQQRVGRP